MGVVTYDGKKLIPAPLVNVQKNYNRTNDGRKVGSSYSITLNGRLLSWRGSPAASGFNNLDTVDDKFWSTTGYPPDQADQGLDALLIKQEALRHLFSQDGKSLEVQCDGDSPPFKCYPRITTINFPDQLWAQTMDYSISLEASEVFGLFDAEDFLDGEDYFVDDNGNKLYINSAEETWSLETQEQPEAIGLQYTYRLTHNINAVGQRVYDGDGLESTGWEQAQRWVVSRMGLDTNFFHSTSGLNLPNYYKALNHIVVEDTDELGGAYTINETWVVASGNITEDFNISKNESLESPYTNVSIEGSIQGLDLPDTTKYSAARTKWLELTVGSPVHDIFNRAQLYAGITLNSQPLQNSYATNPIAGNINYTFQYDDRPSNYITGAKVETISIQDTKPADVIGRVVVLGRAAGPVLQDMGTITEYKRTLSIDVIMPRYSGVAPTTVANVTTMLNEAPSNQIYALVDAFDANLRNSYNQVFVENDQSNWNPKTGQYSRNITWLYQDCILSAQEPPYSGVI